MAEPHHFLLGTRGSPLALWQAERVQALLKDRSPAAEIEIRIIHTTGDKILDKPLVQIGDKGLFTKEIETALQNGEIDFAVHSYKDLPTIQPEGLGIVAVPERDSPFDALVSHTATCLRDLPDNPIVATGSLRRRAQVLAIRPDANVVDIRGNVNTRLRKFGESNWDALIMAETALRRMGWTDRIAGVLSPEEMIPAPAQGALAVEARLEDPRTATLLHSIHDGQAAVTVQAERAFLATLEGGCQVPMAAYARILNGAIHLSGLLANLDGSRCIRQSLTGSAADPASLGRLLAERILEAGGREIINDLTRQN